MESTMVTTVASFRNRSHGKADSYHEGIDHRVKFDIRITPDDIQDKDKSTDADHDET